MSREQDAYDQVRYYTLSLGDPAFIHQHVVDAFIAQHADENTKPIAITFALVGLYLHVEKGFTGQQVQRAHMELAREKRTWPAFELPDERGSMSPNCSKASRSSDDHREPTASSSVWAVNNRSPIYFSSL